MLVPDNIHPERTLYYNGALVLKALQVHRELDLISLYEHATIEQVMSFPVLVLCLDWLYLLNLVEIDEQGVVTLCS